jgi:DNA-binding MarR family transcriptional regulator
MTYPSGLARRAFVTPQTMNQVLRELEQKGWVARHPDPAHARILQADLTEAGRAALRACHRAVNDIEERMLAPLTPGDVQQFTATLRACVQALSPARLRWEAIPEPLERDGGGFMPAVRLMPTEESADLIELTRDIVDKELRPRVDKAERA